MLNLLKTQKNTDLKSTQSGFSLMVVLAFVGLISSIIAIMALENRGAVQREQARAAGWHLAQIAKAARIYVRDRSLDPADEINHPYHKSRLTGSGVEISLSDLINADLLPADFPDINILNQEVLIFAGLSPVGGDVDEASTVATAYVYLAPSTLTSRQPELMQDLVGGAKEAGIYVDAPIVDPDSGAILSGDCSGDGVDDVGIWDTTCINATEFSTITSTSFTPGALIAPSWRSINYDNRAVMRFPQPENPGYATMMTTLELGTPVVGCDPAGGTNVVRLTVPDGAGGAMMEATALCEVHSDVAGAANTWETNDRRVDMLNVETMDALTIVAAPQTADMAVRLNNAGVASAISEAKDGAGPTNEVISVSDAIITDSNVWASGRDPSGVMAGRADVQINGTLGIDHNITMTHTSGNPALSVTGDTDANTLVVNTNLEGRTLDVKARTGAENFDISGGAINVQNCAGPDCGVISDRLNSGGRVTANNEAVFLSGLNSSNIDVTSSTGIALNTAFIRGNSSSQALIGRDLNADASVVTNGQATMESDLSMRECFNLTGQCPDLTKDPPDGVDYGGGR